MHQLPETGFLRLKQIIGDPEAETADSSNHPCRQEFVVEGVKVGPTRPRELGRA